MPKVFWHLKEKSCFLNLCSEICNICIYIHIVIINYKMSEMELLRYQIRTLLYIEFCCKTQVQNAIEPCERRNYYCIICEDLVPKIKKQGLWHSRRREPVFKACLLLMKYFFWRKSFITTLYMNVFTVLYISWCITIKWQRL